MKFRVVTSGVKEYAQSMSLGEEKTISVSTFRKSGDGVATPTWVVPLSDGRIGFWTSSRSGKAKRLRNDPRVTIAPCTNRGKVVSGAVTVSGTAQLVAAGPEFDEIQRKVKAKYGVMVPISRFFNTLGHIGKGSFPYGDTGVVVTVES
ncbi:PPOX class F420-dependent oxidoreductase [Rhodococcus sp. OK302]|uniref:PPOX class F420-dependent oxidoreductase n=1 Tax=Rhodococcus sp. OK302 TaxID=1882769 RepID=UPI000B9F4C90|nr:PPOX class F420-dependent oxidoreductase [Rhodococcus sp. OK302]OYD70909.1 hypothetical protein BDB13_4552 [Rhodococcus sp. OK302]